MRLLDLDVYDRMVGSPPAGRRAAEAAARSASSSTRAEPARRRPRPRPLEAAAAEQTARSPPSRRGASRPQPDARRPGGRRSRPRRGRARAATRGRRLRRAIAVPQSIRTLAERHAGGARRRSTPRPRPSREASAARRAAVAARQPLPDLAGLRGRAPRPRRPGRSAWRRSTPAEATRSDGARPTARLPRPIAMPPPRRPRRRGRGARSACSASTPPTPLAETLVPGEPCPVCDQVVARRPEAMRPAAAVADAKRRVDGARAGRWRAARAGHAAAEKQMAGAARRLETLADQRAQLAEVARRSSRRRPHSMPLDRAGRSGGGRRRRTQAAENDAPRAPSRRRRRPLAPAATPPLERGPQRFTTAARHGRRARPRRRPTAATSSPTGTHWPRGRHAVRARQRSGGRRTADGRGRTPGARPDAGVAATPLSKTSASPAAGVDAMATHLARWPSAVRPARRHAVRRDRGGHRRAGRKLERETRAVAARTPTSPRAGSAAAPRRPLRALARRRGARRCCRPARR